MANNKEYLESLMNDLSAIGVKPDGYISSEERVNQLNDIDLQAILEMEQITGVQYSEEQREILKHRGNACILACAGSGKTSTSIALIAKRLKTGEIRDVNKMIYTTYSKAGATEMKERLDKLLNQLGIKKNIQVRTLHSFFLSVLRTFGVTADIIKDKDRTKYIRESCRDAEFIPKDDDLMLVDNLLSYQVNNLLSDRKTINSYVNTLEDLSVEQYSKIRTGYANRKAQAGVIDYDDMQSYLYLWLCKYAKSENENERAIAKSVRDYCRAMYTDFYIDEAQDVCKIQYAIIRAMITNPETPNKLEANLVFIGDDDQCIYQWRGSDPSIILSVGPTFDMRTFVLSTNYRCGSEIVKYSAKGVEHNSSRYAKSMQAYNNGGSVKILPSSKEDLCSLSQLALNHIKWWLKQGDNVGDIAVLARNNFHLAILSNMLLREGIYCNITEDMKLTKSYMYKDIKALIEFCEPNWKYENTSAVLWKLCRYMNTSMARIIADFQNNCSLSFSDTMGYIVKTFFNKDLDFDKKLNINIQAFEKLKYHTSKITRETAYDMELLYNATASGVAVDCLRVLLHQYLDCTQYLYKSKDKQRSIRGLVNYITNLVSADGLDKTREFLRVTEQFESGNMGVFGDKLTLSTIHSAKGREWKNVIMFACDNVSQPSLDGIYKLVEDGVSVSDIFENINEERRLCYVGNTRAKENLLVITYNMPSMFMLEALGCFDKNSNHNDRILRLAQDSALSAQYSSFVEQYINNKDSEYYYNKEDYII